MSTSRQNVRDPDPEQGGSFNGPVYRDHFRCALVSANNSALTLAAVHAPDIVENPANGSLLAGLVDLGAADGARFAWVMEPGTAGPTTPIAAFCQLEPFGRAAAAIPGQPEANNAAAYIQQPVSDVAAVALTAGTLQVGATLAAALNADPLVVAAGITVLSTWVFAHQVAAPGTPMTGVDRYSPGNNQVAHVDFFPSQGVRFLRALSGQTSTTNKIITLVRRLRGDGQGT